MPPKVQKSKAAKLLAAQSASRSKGKKKKWSKGKLREKKSHKVVFNSELFNQFISQVPKKLKVITIYAIVDLFKINCSLARRGIKELLEKNLIIPVAPSGTMAVYTPNPANEKVKAAKAEGEAAASEKKAPAGKGSKASAKAAKKQAEAEAAAEAVADDE